LSVNEAALRYSKVLFNLASSNEERENQLGNLNEIVAIFNQNPQIALFFSSPHISPSIKIKSLETSLTKYLDKKMISFFSVLLEKKRFQSLPGIVKEYGRLVNKEMGIMDAHLIAAEPIDAILKEKLAEKLGKIYHSKILIKEKIDPSLIAGGILLIANQLIDFSIKTKLIKLKKDLLSMYT
jgi:F-type H+-transporting ATPase subunit delta